LLLFVRCHLPTSRSDYVSALLPATSAGESALAGLVAEEPDEPVGPAEWCPED
jgi:hypothetical protein